MAYTNGIVATDPVGSGNPYQGSGFTNFDRYLNEQNINWGAQQPAMIEQGDDYTNDPSYDNWMIEASGRAGFPVAPVDETPVVIPDRPHPPAQVEPTQPYDPEDVWLPKDFTGTKNPGGTGKGPIKPPIGTGTPKPRQPRPPGVDDPTAVRPVTTYPTQEPDISYPGGKTPNNKNPKNPKEAFPSLSNALYEGGW
jgi:hypothetical protein